MPALARDRKDNGRLPDGMGCRGRLRGRDRKHPPGEGRLSGRRPAQEPPEGPDRDKPPEIPEQKERESAPPLREGLIKQLILPMMIGHREDFSISQ